MLVLTQTFIWTISTLPKLVFFITRSITPTSEHIIYPRGKVKGIFLIQETGHKYILLFTEDKVYSFRSRLTTLPLVLITYQSIIYLGFWLVAMAIQYSR